jgi:hypothetical protein
MPKQMARYGILMHILKQEFSLRLLYLQNLLAPMHHLHPQVQKFVQISILWASGMSQEGILCLPLATPMLFHRHQESAKVTVSQLVS